MALQAAPARPAAADRQGSEDQVVQPEALAMDRRERRATSCRMASLATLPSTAGAAVGDPDPPPTPVTEGHAPRVKLERRPIVFQHPRFLRTAVVNGP